MTTGIELGTLLSPWGTTNRAHSRIARPAGSRASEARSAAAGGRQVFRLRRRSLRNMVGAVAALGMWVLLWIVFAAGILRPAAALRATAAEVRAAHAPDVSVAAGR